MALAAPAAPLHTFQTLLPYTLHRGGVPTTASLAAQFRVPDDGLSPLHPHGIPPGSGARPMGLSAWSAHGPTYLEVLRLIGCACFTLAPPAPLGELVVVYKSRNRRAGGAWHWLFTCSADTDVRTLLAALTALPWLPCDLAAAGARDPPADLPRAPDPQIERLYAALRWTALDAAAAPTPRVPDCRLLEAAAALDDLLISPSLGWRDIASPGSPWTEDFGWMSESVRAFAAAHAGAFRCVDDEVETLLCAEELEGCARGDFIDDAESEGGGDVSDAPPAVALASLAACTTDAEAAAPVYVRGSAQSRTGLAGGSGGGPEA